MLISCTWRFFFIQCLHIGTLCHWMVELWALRFLIVTSGLCNNPPIHILEAVGTLAWGVFCVNDFTLAMPLGHWTNEYVSEEEDIGWDWFVKWSLFGKIVWYSPFRARGCPGSLWWLFCTGSFLSSYMWSALLQYMTVEYYISDSWHHQNRDMGKELTMSWAARMTEYSGRPSIIFFTSSEHCPQAQLYAL